MPVGTQATVKGVSPAELELSGVNMLLANAYHLHLRPGAETIRSAGGLHRFMHWDRGILTDSGGFQVFSLARLSRVDDAGYHFASHLDGSPHTFTPESVVELQAALGSDVAMVLDDCPPAGVDEIRARASAQRTLQWAERARRVAGARGQLTFAIVQGSTFEALRRQQCRDLAALGFDGHGIGGLWVGERKAASLAMARVCCEELPPKKPRYLMGVGTPEDILDCIAAGVDMFDSVYPTRCARHGLALTARGRVNLRNARRATEFTPLDADCGCETCRSFTRAYVAHLVRAGELLAARLISIHNITYLEQLTAAARHAILEGRFASWSGALRDRLRESQSKDK